MPSVRRPLRILEVVHAFPPEGLGGTELYTHHLSLALERRGHRVTVLYGADAEEGEPLSMTSRSYRGVRGIEFRRPRPRTIQREIWNPEFDVCFAELLETSTFDLIHFQHLLGLSVSWLNVARLAGVPTSLKVDDMFFYCERIHLTNHADEHCAGGPESLDKCVTCLWGQPWQELSPAYASQRFGELAYRRSLMMGAMAAPDFVHFASAFVERDAARHGYRPRRGQVIHTGIAPFALARRSERGSRVRVGYMGAIHSRKGIQHLLIAALRFLEARKARNAEPELEFLVYGTQTDQTTLYERLQQAVASTPGLEYGGEFGPDERGSILARFDVLVVPSLGENYPFIIREALFAGVPVVATDIAGVSEIVRDGENGWLVPPGDPDALQHRFEALARDPGLLQRLMPGEPPVKTIHEEAAELESIFEELVGQASASAGRAQDPQVELEDCLAKGRSLIERQAFWEAACVFGEARNTYGDRPEVLLGLGVASFHLGNADRAFDLLWDAQRLAPTDADIAVSLGLAAEKTGQLGRVAMLLERACAEHPHDALLGELWRRSLGARSA